MSAWPAIVDRALERRRGDFRFFCIRVLKGRESHRAPRRIKYGNVKLLWVIFVCLLQMKVVRTLIN